MRHKNKFTIIIVLIVSTSVIFSACRDSHPPRKPNILFAIADDHSFPFASAYGSELFKTPAFDEVAQRGVLFMNAFVGAPQCSPSRAALLTGLNIWQLEEAGTHGSYFPSKFKVFTQSLESNGYATGFTGKAWGPGNWQDAGWKTNPVGTEFNDIKAESVPSKGISRTDYVANFRAFLDARQDDQPFFFWFGAHEPHRVYEYGSGKRHFGDKRAELPAFLPQHDSIMNDMLDYAFEVSWFDQQLEMMLSILEESGELDNTIVVVTADNGMAFPLAKANLQEYGIHVPLAICGPGIPGGRRVQDLVSLIDLAPTFVELAGAEKMLRTTGKSLAPLLKSTADGVVDTTRRFVLTGLERHTHARPNNDGYPARAIRTHEFLYIRNFKPQLWPVGNPSPPDEPGIQGFEDIDDSPSKRVMMQNRHEWARYFEMAFAMRPQEQLYDIRKDPACIEDLSSDHAYVTQLTWLRQQLEQELTQQKDPRMLGTGNIFDTYPRFGRMRQFSGFRERGKYRPAAIEHITEKH